MSERADWGRGVAKVRVLAGFGWDWDPGAGCCGGGAMVKYLTGVVEDIV